jgi:hypothetical protein
MVNYADELDSSLSVYEDKPKWLYCGQIRLMETRSGYGMKLTSDYKVKFNGKNYRLYWTCISNVGSIWFTCKKYGKLFLRYDNIVCYGK